MISLRLTPEFAYTPSRLKAACADEMGVDVASIKDVRILRRSIDARQRQIFVNLSLEVFIDESAPELCFAPIVYPDVSEKPAVIVVGAGPGGLFAALRLIELGLRPIVLEGLGEISQDHLDLISIGNAMTRLYEGGSIGDLYVTALRTDSHGHIYVDYVDNSVQIDRNAGDLKDGFIYAGNAAPKYTMGWRNSFSW